MAQLFARELIGEGNHGYENFAHSIRSDNPDLRCFGGRLREHRSRRQARRHFDCERCRVLRHTGLPARTSPASWRQF